MVNVPADEAGEAIGILLDQRVYDFDGTSIEAFTQTVAVRLEAIPEMQVNLRADRRIPYETVEPVMEALARAGGLAGRSDGVRVNLVIQIDEGGDT